YTVGTGCDCAVEIELNVAVGTSESWSWLVQDPVTGATTIVAHGTGNPATNPVTFQFTDYTCNQKFRAYLVVACSNGSASVPVDIYGLCGTTCE
ncbi:MAG: hypothetical protein KDC38_18625, partial [Planctomycetes bacterium]|nr:hypothetical protein [Planctomycetota bacterium]